MRTLGIVAEYNPFHNGHEYHLQAAMDNVHPDRTFIALSSCFSQRGDLCMFSPRVRAEMALRAGADAVFALPACWVLRDAGHYSRSAVLLLHSLGVTHLAFGAEETSLDRLMTIATLLEDQDDRFSFLLKSKLSEGTGYPSAIAEVVDLMLPECRGILQKPNNILAVNYLRTIIHFNLDMKPVLIPRKGDYHASEADAINPSASAIRQALCRGDWRALNSLPEHASFIIQKAFLMGETVAAGSLSEALLYKLRGMSEYEYNNLPDLSEGIDNLIMKKAAATGSSSSLLQELTGKRYTSARMNRLLAFALLGIDKDLVIPDRIPVAHLLGLRNGTDLSGSKIPIVSGAKNFPLSDPCLEKEIMAYDLFALATGQPKGYLFTNRIVTI